MSLSQLKGVILFQSTLVLDALKEEEHFFFWSKLGGGISYVGHVNIMCN